MNDNGGTVMSNETKDADKVGLSRRNLLKVTAPGCLQGPQSPYSPIWGQRILTHQALGGQKC